MVSKIVVLNAGRIEQTGSPMDLYDHPATPFVAGFIGSPKMNIYPGEGAAKMGCITSGIRPEYLSLDTTTGLWQGRVHHVEHLGADAILQLNVPTLETLIARAPGDTRLKPGDTVWATPVAGKEHRF